MIGSTVIDVSLDSTAKKKKGKKMDYVSMSFKKLVGSSSCSTFKENYMHQM